MAQGFTWQEMNETVGGFLSPDGHKSAKMGWQDMRLGKKWRLRKGGIFWRASIPRVCEDLQHKSMLLQEVEEHEADEGQGPRQ